MSGDRVHQIDKGCSGRFPGLDQSGGGRSLVAEKVAGEVVPKTGTLNRVIDGSPPNPSNDRRIGFAIRYIPTTVAQLAGEDSATLVRGGDRHHHFIPEPQPSRDLDPSGRETPSNAGAVAIRHDQRASYGFLP